MKIAEAVFVMAVFFSVLVTLTIIVIRPVGRAALRRYRAWRDKRTPWELSDPESDGEMAYVYAKRPGEEHLLIGAVPIAAADFDARLYVVKAEGRMKVAALNEGGT